MADNEHPTAALGHSEVLSVKHPVGPPIPEVRQRPKDDGHVSASVAGEQARDVLDANPAGSAFRKDASELEPQSAPLASQASTTASHAEVLTGESPANKVNWGEGGAADRTDVGEEPMAKVGSKLALQDELAVPVDLDLPPDAVASSGKAEIEASDAGEERANGEHSPPVYSPKEKASHGFP
jgi:hypothetical protein